MAQLSTLNGTVNNGKQTRNMWLFEAAAQINEELK